MTFFYQEPHGGPMPDDYLFKAPNTTADFHLKVGKRRIGPFRNTGSLEHLEALLLRRGVLLIKDLNTEVAGDNNP